MDEIFNTSETTSSSCVPDLCAVDEIDSLSSASVNSEDDSSSESADVFDSLDTCIDANTVAQLIHSRKSKRQRTGGIRDLSLSFASIPEEGKRSL